MAFVSKPSKNVISQQTSTRRSRIRPGLWLSINCPTSTVGTGSGEWVVVSMRAAGCPVRPRPSVRGVVNGRAPHIAPVASVFERCRPMHGAAIIPDDQVPRLFPGNSLHELRSRREFNQLLQQLAACLD